MIIKHSIFIPSAKLSFTGVYCFHILTFWVFPNIFKKNRDGNSSNFAYTLILIRRMYVIRIEVQGSVLLELLPFVILHIA